MFKPLKKIPSDEFILAVNTLIAVNAEFAYGGIDSSVHQSLRDKTIVESLYAMSVDYGVKLIWPLAGNHDLSERNIECMDHACSFGESFAAKLNEFGGKAPGAQNWSVCAASRQCNLAVVDAEKMVLAYAEQALIIDKVIVNGNGIQKGLWYVRSSYDDHVYSGPYDSEVLAQNEIDADPELAGGVAFQHEGPDHHAGMFIGLVHKITDTGIWQMTSPGHAVIHPRNQLGELPVDDLRSNSLQGLMVAIDYGLPGKQKISLATVHAVPYLSDPQTARSSGKIVSENEHNYFQSLGRGAFLAHDKSKVGDLAIGQVFDIKYKGASVTVNEVVKTREMCL